MSRWFRLWRWLTRGRPMTLVAYDFTDVVSGEAIYLARDLYGRTFMTTSRWALFRVRAEGRG